jgi:NitT/TauT family transport system ATP-binding protein
MSRIGAQAEHIPADPGTAAGPMTEILTAHHIAKGLGHGSGRTEIIGDLSLAARTGEFLSVVGPSGCGKTTLLFCLAGLYALDRGTVAFKGTAMVAPPAGISIVFQDYSRSLLPWKNNLENVVFGMRRLGDLGAGAKRQRARELLVSVGLTRFEHHYPWQVSGGMQQRVAIARALAAQPELLLLDEPLAAVDAQTRAELQDLLLDLAVRFRQTCVLVTHDVDEAVYVADRVVVLSPRPTQVLEDIRVPLTRPRDQLSTREDRVFLDIRHRVVSRIRSMRRSAPQP